jgi:hypothetical protein
VPASTAGAPTHRNRGGGRRGNEEPLPEGLSLPNGESNAIDQGSSVGVFAQWQPRYAERGISTFPVDGGKKKPVVRGYLHVGPDVSRQLALKFPAIDAFGLALGQRNRITVLDVDTNDERVLADALSRHGQTPLIVRSGGGNHQAWYRHNGERRRIRPQRGVPVDILGDGYVVAPPSQGRLGRYQIIQGSLDDLMSLPTMRGPETRIAAQVPSPRMISIGQRNKELFSRALFHARATDDFDALLDAVSTENLDGCTVPLPDDEVVKLAKSAWRYQLEGRNFVGRGRQVYANFDEIDDLAAADPDALALLLIVRRYHGDREQFALANGMAVKLGWRLARFKETRRRLETYGAIECVRRGGRGKHDPAIYRLGLKGCGNAPQS